MTNTRDSASPIDAVDEELIDTLIAISVVAKRLAAKLRQSTENQRESEEAEVKKYSFQEVRGIMASLAGKGKKAEAKAILTKYGASRLSDVKEEYYPALVAEAEVIVNG